MIVGLPKQKQEEDALRVRVWIECVYSTLKLCESACVEMYRGATVDSTEALLSGMEIQTHSLLKRKD